VSVFILSGPYLLRRGSPQDFDVFSLKMIDKTISLDHILEKLGGSLSFPSLSGRAGILLI
jgi:hypothetical protein